MRTALFRFYFGIVLLVLLLFFSLNQLYSWMYQRDDLAAAAQSMLKSVAQVQTQGRLHCQISDNDDCLDALFVSYPADYWQPQPHMDYAIEVMRDAKGNASLCSEMSSGTLLCLSQLELPDGTDFSIDLAHVFILLLLLSLFGLSRHLFRDVDTLRKSALQEIKLGKLPAFRLSAKSYLAPLAQSLSGMNQTIQDLNRLQREMADTVCHDIKTPLARLRFILLRVEAELGEQAYAQVVRNLQEIEDNVYDYLRLAQQDFRADLQLSDLNLTALAQELIDKFAANSESKLQLIASDALQIQADQKLLQRAVSNLLSNALRYCHSQVWLRLQVVDGYCWLDVEDDGPGWQAESESSCPSLAAPDGMPHHGIGLAIVRRVAQQHGGELRCLPRPAGGAIARLCLPLDSQQPSVTPT